MERSVKYFVQNKVILFRLIGKFYTTVVRPAMIYGSKCSTIDRKIEHRMSVEEMKILRSLSGMTRENKIFFFFIAYGKKIK